MVFPSRLNPAETDGPPLVAGSTASCWPVVPSNTGVVPFPQATTLLRPSGLGAAVVGDGPALNEVSGL